MRMDGKKVKDRQMYDGETITITTMMGEKLEEQEKELHKGVR